MININPEAGEVQRFTEPLATLAGYRRAKVRTHLKMKKPPQKMQFACLVNCFLPYLPCKQGKIMFGILLRYENNTKTESDTWIRVGEEIIPNGDRH